MGSWVSRESFNMKARLTRRDFLKLGLLCLGTLAFRGYRPHGLGRVTNWWIKVYREASFQSESTRKYKRDQLVLLIEKIVSPDGPAYNPRWYRTLGGYVHSGYLQYVETHLNKPLEHIPEDGQLGEITVPYTQSWGYDRSSGWYKLYRLYYSSLHWITGIDEGPDKRWNSSDQPWYRITDDRLRVHYHVPATHVRLIAARELSPISPDVPPEDKSVQVSLEDQTMTAYEGDQAVFHTTVSTGKHSDGPTINGIPTDTPTGRFNISHKMPVRHMGNGELTSNPFNSELIGVPWCCFFVSTGVSFHGTYWHDNFGYRMSHGCVNMRNDDAKWLFRWSTPTLEPTEWRRLERGTRVHVF